MRAFARTVALSVVSRIVAAATRGTFAAFVFAFRAFGFRFVRAEEVAGAILPEYAVELRRAGAFRARVRVA